MSLNTLKIILSGIFLTSSSLWGIFETKRFDAKQNDRIKYLNYMMPKNLRFSQPEIVADRGNLLPIKIITVKTQLPVVDISENNVSSSPDFPIISYESSLPDENSPEITSSDDQLINEASVLKEPLPLADPFEEISKSSINSTDELLNVFEQSNISSNSISGERVLIPFIPPNSSMPDNLKLSNRSIYRRVQR